ncbi:hypothetical protein JWZ98_03280 [Methylomonas sp. EFPC1]|uniref:hypothetical protein n=1 Tax=Methylomonas sp. EFPC1 TaxID=2812647 RepID=UPI001967D743|nr:hypothetical protein [Methylomonas sp. EFPC1]QSB01998.1 hypothetical protein JWZ98_03280 [Methylomonas sp. EFPC1]
MPYKPVKTGDYIIRYFNRYGARLKDLEDTATSYGLAEDTGNAQLFDPEQIKDRDENHFLPVSFVIERRIFNSLDKQ